MNIAYISAGSNIGDREANLNFGARRLGERGKLIQASSFFETEPVGYADQPWFLNQVFELETALTPRELLAWCNEIERGGGRVRTFPNAPRTLDLDILFYGDRIISEPDLIIPHPRMTERRFVLEPLGEIAPELRHPVEKKTVRDLLANCPDAASVRKFHAQSAKIP
ncbi:MAG: 2-amino-4-hydroxy-6-hydroxymethyldihydropteridine diphosphokinase [Acidobacteriota bacterium]|jgi:2-amino-4-hydroxy-6-hydroxymethyldihydropteridine diphosphokinase|nr:2-amino-4-hydroxy-6-hydroxymethyldihydropteridine diphosphokinase [Acidobacteriota bacterium]